jgi:hypothetical protein
MRNELARRVAALVAVALAATVCGQASQGSGSGGSSTARAVSPTVVASWSSGWTWNSATTLLVLWRGSPGWFTKGDGHGISGGGSGGGAGGSWSYQTFSEGGLSFTLMFDVDRKIVKLLDQEVSLEQANVVLVDDVDGAAGPRIAGRLWIEPAPEGQPQPPDAIAAIVKRSPELFAYLQCDLAPTDQVARMLAQIGCAQMRP